MPDCAVQIRPLAPGSRIAYPQSRPIEFCPWIRTETIETHVVVSDLVHTLARNVGTVSRYWEQRLDRWAGMERVVDQFSADGRPLARYSKRLVEGEIWRLSLGLANASSLEYGVLVFSGSYALCHFQIVGPRTFATCHGRRFPLLEPAQPHPRGIPVQLDPGQLLSLFIVNRGAGNNDVTLSTPMGSGQAQAATVTIPRMGCRIVSLNRLFPGIEMARPYERVSITSTYPYDFYTIVENGLAQEETFSFQHIK